METTFKKIMIYQGEKNDFFGYKPTKFDFKKGTKVLLKESGKAIVVTAVFDLGNEAFRLFKYIFGAIKNNKSSSSEKTALLEQVAMTLSGAEGEHIAATRLAIMEEKQSDNLENLFNAFEH